MNKNEDGKVWVFCTNSECKNNNPFEVERLKNGNIPLCEECWHSLERASSAEVNYHLSRISETSVKS